MVFRCQPNASRRDDAPIHIALGPALDHRRPWLDWASSQFGAGDIHENPAIAPGFFASLSEVADHTQPDLRIIVRAVDAHAVHAVLYKVANQFVISSGIRVHGDHDAHFSFRRWRPKQRISVRFEELSSFAKLHGRLRRGRERAVGAQQNV
jgi:hypothetical protein